MELRDDRENRRATARLHSSVSCAPSATFANGGVSSRLLSSAVLKLARASLAHSGERKEEERSREPGVGRRPARRQVRPLAPLASSRPAFTRPSETAITAERRPASPRPASNRASSSLSPAPERGSPCARGASASVELDDAEREKNRARKDAPEESVVAHGLGERVAAVG